MKTTKIKTQRYLLFYGTEKTTNINGNIEDITFEGEYSSISDASVSFGFALNTNKTVWAYIWDTKKKDFHSYTQNFSSFSM